MGTMSYTDIHIHGLAGVDDGAKSEAEMFQIVDAAYTDGARCICLTPHFHPGYFGENQKKAEEAFRILKVYETEHHPDLSLSLGNELRYSEACVSWLNDGVCRTLANTNHVLVDFSKEESQKSIIGGIERLLRCGYVPILAHVERYTSLRGRRQLLWELRDNGVLLQIDGQSIFGGVDLRTQMWTNVILRERLVDIVASDAHDLVSRPPGMDRSYRYIKGKYGAAYADAVCRCIPGKIMSQPGTRKEMYG